MRNGSVFRLQEAVRLNGDGSLLFTAAGVCCIRWYGSQHDMQLIKSILQGNVWWAPFQSNNSGALGAHVSVRAHAHKMNECVCVHTLEESLHSTQNKGQGQSVCLFAICFWNKVISSKYTPLNRCSWLSETNESRDLVPISGDRLLDSGHLTPQVPKS